MTTDHRIAMLLQDQADAHACDVALKAKSAYYDLAANCESPIERLLLVPLMFIKPQVLAPRYEGPIDYEREARLFAQYPVAGRRLDFAYIVTTETCRMCARNRTWETRHPSGETREIGVESAHE